MSGELPARLAAELDRQNAEARRQAAVPASSLDEIKELLALRQKHHVCSAVQSMLHRKVADVRAKIKSLARLEAELNSALHNCNRELRIQGQVQHHDCCPLLDELGRMNGRNHGARTRKSARK